MTIPSDLVSKKVLSIQSHVVHGYVGNKAATFPLQYKGWDVDSLNTVNYSNHPGYPTFTGTKTSSLEIKDVYKGLMEIGCVYDVLLTGYIADASSLEIVNEICSDYIDNHNNQCIWVLDPVLGDNGKLYVSKEILPIYQKMLRSERIKLVTPNQFEMELLTDMKINSLLDLRTAILKFHDLYKVPNVVVTSVHLDGLIYCAGSSIGSDPFYFQLPIIDAAFSGSGDLFSSILMDRFYEYYETPKGLTKSLGEALTTVEKVLKISFELTQNELNSQGKPNAGGKLYVKDLKIIQAKSVFLENESLYDVHFNW